MQLSTDRDLARYHRARAALYASFAAWFSGVPARAPLPPDLHHRARALLPSPTGADTYAPAVVARLPPGGEDSVRVMAFLAAEAADAFSRADLTKAAALFDAQCAFLNRHGSRVLGEACAALADSDDPQIRGLGSCLRALIDDDAQTCSSVRPRPADVTDRGHPLPEGNV